jgi:hypothetical protein
MKATFKGTSGSSGSDWSNPSNWVGGKVPISSHRLHVQIDAGSTEDLGTAQAPFQTDDIIGASVGLSAPSLDVTGFLHAHDIKNLGGLSAEGGGSIHAHAIKNVRFLSLLATHSTLDVTGDIVNVQQLTVTEESVAHVRGSLVNVQNVSLSFGASLEVGHDIGSTKFVFGIPVGTLILDHPERGKLTNSITLAPNDRIELGNLVFDKADFLPNAPGSSTGEVQLSEHGHSVYELTNVAFPFTAVGTGSVGIDKATGFHFFAFSGQPS